MQKKPIQEKWKTKEVINAEVKNRKGEESPQKNRGQRNRNLLKRKIIPTKLIPRERKILKHDQKLLEVQRQKGRPILNRGSKKIKKMHQKVHKANQKKQAPEANLLHVDNIS